MLSFHFQDRFPETCRAFADGELSVRADRYGGLLDISVIDIEHCGGRDYPDNCCLPVFSRDAGKAVGRPLYGPALKILSEDFSGQLCYHDFLSPEVWPWGVISGEKDCGLGMVLDRECILFRCRNRRPGRKLFRIAVSRQHLFQGEFRSSKNQRTGDGCEQHCRRAGVPWNPEEPIANGQAAVSWKEPDFDAERQLLLWSGKILFPYGERECFMALACSAPVQLKQHPRLWILEAAWGRSREITAALVMGRSRQEVLEKAAGCGRDFASVLRRKKARGTAAEKRAVRLEIREMPSAATMMQAAAGYTDSLLLHRIPAIRAAQMKYSVFMMWDSLCQIRDLLWQGNQQAAQEIYRSFLGYPYIENSAWVVSQLMLVLEEILSFIPDSPLKDEAWPWLKKYLDFQLKLTNPDSGLVSSFMNCGVDVPHELGLSGLYAAPCINGWWYGGLRAMENLALEKGERQLAEQLGNIISRIEESYLKGFFSEEEGYLFSGIQENLEPPAVAAFQNTSTLALDYPFGRYLLRKVLLPLADYQSKKLYHPAGHTAVAWDSQIECEMWTALHMNQHDGHEALLQRLTDQLPEAKRMIAEFLREFDFYKSAVETTNFSGCLGNERQTSDWQGFTATGVCEALRSGIAGIGRHRGGLYYIPAEDSQHIVMKNIPWGKSVVEVKMTGRGKYFEPMRVNGRRLAGTAQIPADCFDGKNIQWIIRRTQRPFTGPVLLNSYGLPVRNLCAEEKYLGFTAGSKGHYVLEFAAPDNTEMTVGGRKVLLEHVPNLNRCFFDGYFNEGDRVELRG